MILHFKWSTSKARDTYGYNICSLWVDGKKIASCNGGGYDMRGTVVGDWVAKRFKSELLKVSRAFYGLTFHNPDYDPGKATIEGETIEEREKASKSLGLERYQAIYNGCSSIPTPQHRIPSIDGAYGLSCVETILEAIDHKLQWIESDIYQLD